MSVPSNNFCAQNKTCKLLSIDLKLGILIDWMICFPSTFTKCSKLIKIVNTIEPIGFWSIELSLYIINHVLQVHTGTLHIRKQKIKFVHAGC